MTTRKSTSKTATKRTPKASETQEQQAATPQPNAGDSAQAPEAGGVEATQVKDAATQETATEPAAKEGPSNAAEDQPKASEKGEKINTPRGEEIPAVFVRTRKRYGSRRRAGFRFTREGHGIALSALTDEQLEQLHADPALEVEECTFPADDDGEPEQ